MAKNKFFAFAQGNGILLIYAFLAYLALVKGIILLFFFKLNAQIILHLLFALFLVLSMLMTWKLFRSET